LGLVMLTSFGWDVKPRSSLCHTHSIIHGLKRSRPSCPRRVSAGYKKTLYQACTFPEVGMWPPKRWEIESSHIRIFLLGTGRTQRRRRSKNRQKSEFLRDVRIGIRRRKYTYT
jgi:hypothetical protein